MLKWFRLAALGALLIGAISSTIAHAQPFFSYALRIPNYDDPKDAGQHVAFSMFLARLVRIANDARLPAPCLVDFVEANSLEL